VAATDFGTGTHKSSTIPGRTSFGKGSISRRVVVSIGYAYLFFLAQEFQQNAENICSRTADKYPTRGQICNDFRDDVLGLEVVVLHFGGPNDLLENTPLHQSE
jgi:hypothetical protein